MIVCSSLLLTNCTTLYKGMDAVHNYQDKAMDTALFGKEYAESKIARREKVAAKRVARRAAADRCAVDPGRDECEQFLGYAGAPVDVQAWMPVEATPCCEWIYVTIDSY